MIIPLLEVKYTHHGQVIVTKSKIPMDSKENPLGFYYTLKVKLQLVLVGPVVNIVRVTALVSTVAIDYLETVTPAKSLL